MNQNTNLKIELKTARARLFLPEPREAANVLDYFNRNREFHSASSPKFPDHFYTEEYWAERLQMSLNEAENDQSLRLFAETSDRPGRMMASVSLSQIVRGPFQACYLGYSLDAANEGKGLMTECLAGAIKYAFQSMHLHRIMANYLPENERSGKVLERLGFNIDGRSNEYLFINGAWREHVMTSLTNQSWVPREADRFLFE
jgi:ribosomal-protein-alanine N-acetyltransferase